jgi:large subunit ribosomal protein L25
MALPSHRLGSALRISSIVETPVENQVTASARTASTGKENARKIRANGKVPAVVYGSGSGATSIELDPRPLVEIFRKSNNRNTVVTLDIDGKSTPTLVREVQRHPLSRQILHIDFMAVVPNQPVVVPVPVRVVGKSKAQALGGRVNLVRRSVKVAAPYDQIPEFVDVDVTELDVGDTVRISTVATPANTNVVWDNDFQVLSIEGKMRDRAEGAEAGAAAAAPAAAAPAAKAPAKK